MIRKIRDILLAHGLSDQTANGICTDIAQILGSGRHYIARSDFAERNREIMAGFRGNNYDDLANSYGITPRQVRRIIKRK